MKLAILVAVVAYTSMGISYCDADGVTFATAVCSSVRDAKMCKNAV